MPPDLEAALANHWDDDGDATFADVCVAKLAGAKGEQTDAALAAEMVFVFGDHHFGDFRRHDGDRHDCDGDGHGDGTDNDDRDWGDHDGKDASFTSDRGDDHDRNGDWGGKDRHDGGGWDHGHDD